LLSTRLEGGAKPSENQAVNPVNSLHSINQKKKEKKKKILGGLGWHARYVVGVRTVVWPLQDIVSIQGFIAQ